MTKARIYKPAKTSMQSGRGKKQWMLELDVETARVPEGLMGWIASGDTLNQVKIPFETKEQAVAFAQNKNLEFYICEPQLRTIPRRSYMDNFND